ncbi:MAG: hypothetical protein QNL62_01455 [Gammaproteobacteria bacterium]|nr:hypothetical protein [Gammaproteobacteria bacterium]
MSGTLSQNQQADRFPVKPVTIEGQVVKDNDGEKRGKELLADKEPSAGKEPLAGKEPSANKELSASLVQNLENEAQQQLISPLYNTASISDSLLIQKELNRTPEHLNASEQIYPAEPFPTENSFPFSNRRSFNGLAGGSLVIQSYLNNEPQAPSQSGGPSSRIDVFI